MVIPPGVGRESDKEFGLKLYVEKCFTENLVLGVWFLADKLLVHP